jgi:hypothetical protein
MATTPLLTTFLTELRAAVAGMSTPTYNHTLSAGQVTGDPAVPGASLPYVQLYVAGDIPEEPVTVKDRLVTARIFVDCVIKNQGTPTANSAAALLLLHDLSILLHVSRKGAIFAAPNPIVAMEQTLNHHGDADIGGKLPFGRMTLTLEYQRSSAGGF